ncbi:MAG: hypothetical protein DWQ34_14675 [Planctomycetota bacterium]|nr:MAG: hypothetical protein DWQ34_14675 [Planctomycetota bacterium]REJ96508.1 MAG: hypothetical protein DWQ29_00765 [Planctomycetota bacterium]
MSITEADCTLLKHTCATGPVFVQFLENSLWDRRDRPQNSLKLNGRRGQHERRTGLRKLSILPTNIPQHTIGYD